MVNPKSKNPKNKRQNPQKTKEKNPKTKNNFFSLYHLKERDHTISR
jgi:hypothetical protein